MGYIKGLLNLINDGKSNRMGKLKWGLIPGWAKDEKVSYKMLSSVIKYIIRIKISITYKCLENTNFYGIFLFTLFKINITYS